MPMRAGEGNFVSRWQIPIDFCHRRYHGAPGQSHQGDSGRDQQ
jgi:hypothetical protein